MPSIFGNNRRHLQASSLYARPVCYYVCGCNMSFTEKEKMIAASKWGAHCHVYNCSWVQLLPYQTTSSPFFPVKIKDYFHLGGLCATVRGYNCFPTKPFFPVKMEDYFHLGGLCATVCGCNCFPTKPRLHLFFLLR